MSTPRTGANILILFALLYLAALVVIGGWQGLKGALGLAFTFLAILYLYLPLVYLGLVPAVDGGAALRRDHRRDHVPDRRRRPQNGGGQRRHGGGRRGWPA